MDTKERIEELTAKLEGFLNQACEAESEGNYEKAERLFKYAMFYSGKLKPDITDAKQYVIETGPVYQKAIAL